MVAGQGKREDAGSGEDEACGGKGGSDVASKGEAAVRRAELMAAGQGKTERWRWEEEWRQGGRGKWGRRGRTGGGGKAGAAQARRQAAGRRGQRRGARHEGESDAGA